MNQRLRLLVLALAAAMFLLAVWIGGALVSEERYATQLALRNLAPSLQHWFGTDWLGRDMFARTLKGLSVSVGVGIIAAAASSLIAVVLGLAAAVLGRWADRFVTWLIDLFMSVPHLVSLILISFTLGGGLPGVVAGIALTHWPSLARIIRAEVLALRSAEYVQISRRLGKSRMWIAGKHMLPHLRPQLIVGALLLFPHAVLHEAAITFIGLGLSPHEPAIGIILSESMRYLSTGMWWLAFFPGLCLLLVVLAFDVMGRSLNQLWNPHTSQR